MSEPRETPVAHLRRALPDVALLQESIEKALKVTASDAEWFTSEAIGRAQKILGHLLDAERLTR
jgi:hypothetical protein